MNVWKNDYAMKAVYKLNPYNNKSKSAFLIRKLVKASIVEAWAMPKLGTLDYLCEASVRVNVMPNTRM